MRRCARCGYEEYCHRWPAAVRDRQRPVVCHRFERPAPWWLRAAVWLSAGRKGRGR